MVFAAMEFVRSSYEFVIISVQIWCEFESNGTLRCATGMEPGPWCLRGIHSGRRQCVAAVSEFVVEAQGEGAKTLWYPCTPPVCGAGGRHASGTRNP